MSMSRQYRDGALVAEDFSLNEIDEHFHGSSAVWFDLVNPTAEDYRILADELGLHELAIEDSIKGGQRAKIDHYDSHLFINLYQANFPNDTPEVDLAELAIFVTKNAVITVRQNEEFRMHDVIKRWEESAELAHYGVAFLLWGILDVVIDDYFKVIERLDDELEELEDELFQTQPNAKANPCKNEALSCKSRSGEGNSSALTRTLHSHLAYEWVGMNPFHISHSDQKSHIIACFQCAE